MTRPDEAERTLIETEAAKVFTDAHAEEPAAIRARFDRLAEALASRLSPDGRHLLARLAAMYCLSAVIDQGRPISDVELVLGEIETIGFADFTEEALCRFSFARHVSIRAIVRAARRSSARCSRESIPLAAAQTTPNGPISCNGWRRSWLCCVTERPGRARQHPGLSS